MTPAACATMDWPSAITTCVVFIAIFAFLAWLVWVYRD